MKKLLLTLAAIPAATFAVEAHAQGYGQPYGQTNVNAGGTVAIGNRIANLEARFNAGVQAGVIDRTEAARIQRQLASLRQMEQRYGYDGLSRQERTGLQAQIRATRDQIRIAGGSGWANRYGWADSDLDAYGNAYGGAYGNGYATPGYTYDRYGNRVPVQGYTTDRYGNRVPTGYYGQGGPYEPAPSTGVGGLLGGVLGGNSSSGVLGSILGNGGLSIGSVISSVIGNALGGANNYGYRDRSDVYFRSDGQRVYEIDARTNTVVRIHPLR